MNRRLHNRLVGRIFGWFDSKDARVVSPPLPTSFGGRARLALESFEDRVVPAVLVVNTNLDEAVSTPDGVLTLREAMETVNAGNTSALSAAEKAQITGTLGTNDKITFAMGTGQKFETPQVITLAANLPTSTNAFDLVGGLDTGGNFLVTISGGNLFFLFDVSPAPDGAVFNFDKVAITDGLDATGVGAGLFADNQLVTISNSTLSGHTAQQGGAIFLTGTGSLTLTNSTLSGNSATKASTTAIYGGGAIFISSATTATLSLTSTKVISNGADFGGGILANNTKVTITSSEIDFNNANAGGLQRAAGMWVGGTSSLTMTNSSLSGNTAIGAFSGGLYFSGSGNATITGSTISNNSSGILGGGISFFHNASATRVLTIDQCKMDNNVSQRGGAMTLRGGATAANKGVLNITKSTFSGNKATATGGHVLYQSNFQGSETSIVTISQSTLTNNSGTGTGAVAVVGAGTTTSSLTVTDSTISNNTTSGAGPAIHSNNATAGITITGTTISGNTSTGGGGGALYTTGSQNITIRNSTFSGNSVAVNGGAIRVTGNAKTVTINNSTIVGNISNNNILTPGAGGGGIAINSTATLVMNSTVLSGNESKAAGAALHDLSAAATVTLNVNHSMIGSKNGHTPVSTKSFGGGTNVDYPDGTPAVNFAATGLDVLASNGGSTQTHAILVGSPLIDSGSNVAPALATDQRGTGFPREIPTGKPDIGAFEFDPPPIPTASGKFNDITTLSGGFTTSYTFDITYTAPLTKAIDTTTIDTNDVKVTNGAGFDVFPTGVTFVDISSGGDKSKIKATYTIPANSITGKTSWDNPDNGLYTVNVQASQIKATNGTFVAAGALGSFNVDVGKLFEVTNTNDAGAGSLREALFQAKNDPSTLTALDLIFFNPTLFATAKTITLADELVADSDVYINVAFPLAGIATSGAPVTLDQGKADTGVIAFDDDNVTKSISVRASNLIITGGDGQFNGGAFVGVLDKLTLENSAIINNGGAKTFFGGGISLDNSATLNLVNSTISGNVAGDVNGAGGGIYVFLGGTLVIDSSTISGNTALGTAGGGGIYWFGKATQFQITNSTISGNSAPIGGGIITRGLAGDLQIFNSTITANTAQIGGGIARWSGTGAVNLASTIVSGNVAINDPDITSNGSENINATFSAVGVEPSAGWSTSSKNPASKNLPFGAPLFMTPLQNNGGSTLTHALTFGSAAVDAGANPLSLATDQVGGPRVVGTAADIGAREGILPPPDASATLQNIFAGSPDDNKAVYTFTVTYTAPSGGKIDASTLSSGDLSVEGPGGYTASATLVGTYTDAPTIVATYTIPANPAGSAKWDIADNGRYEMKVVANEVKTTTSVPVPAGILGNFYALYSKTFVVTNTNDSGAGSLRDAIEQANSAAFPAHDFITFSDGSGGTTNFNTPQVITPLTTYTVTDSLTITGKGSKLLEINGSGAVRLFIVDDTAFTFTLTGASLVSGFAPDTQQGGAMILTAQTATFNDVVFDNNSAGAGAAIAIADTADLVLTNTIFNANSGTATGFTGGVIRVASGVDASTIKFSNVDFTNNSHKASGVLIGTNGKTAITISKATVTGNTSGFTGVGGLFHFNSTTLTGSLLVEDSKITNNTLSASGLFLGAVESAVVTLRRSTIDSNSGGAFGAVMQFNSGTGTANVLTIEESTISNNAGTGNGLINLNAGSGSMKNSTISGNSVVTWSALVFSGSTFTVANSTITGNSSSTTSTQGGVGGALAVFNTASVLNVFSSIVSGNKSNNGANDIASVGTVNANFSAIGTAKGWTPSGSSGSNLPFDTDLQLDVLANNGGPTFTHKIADTSPAKNAGSNTLFSLPTDQRGPGFNRVGFGVTDIGAYEIQSPIPTVSKIQVNNAQANTTQRSRILNIDITFGGTVNVADFNSLGDIVLTRLAATTTGGTKGFVVNTGNGLVVTQNGTDGLRLTFSDILNNGVESTSLADGRWELKVNPSSFVSSDADPAQAIRRLYGDFDGNGTTDGTDFGFLGFGSGNIPMDYDNNGTVDGIDFGQFGARSGVTI